MKKIAYSLTLLCLALLVLGGYFWKDIRGILPLLLGPSGDIEKLVEDPLRSPLSLPGGFSLSVFAKVPDARVLVFDDAGDLWVSQTKSGAVSRIEIQNGVITSQEVMFSGLNKPHGIAFSPEDSSVLYVAEEHQVSYVNLNKKDKTFQRFLDLPSGDGHNTRTIGFGPDGRLYISIGSSCNVCQEKNEWRASILSVGRSATDVKIFARGLRNTVFFKWHPGTKELWGTDMGRDLLGDNLPPDEVNVIRSDGFYGWPTCYGKNIHDTDFDQNTYIRNPCQEPFETPSYVDIPAHSAPLGLAFVESRFGWPREYTDNLIVAYHGSWNRTAPTGYKLVRMKFGSGGGYLGTEDFITGWFTKDGTVLGRPVDVVFGPDKALYVSDDSAGVIYRIQY